MIKFQRRKRQLDIFWLLMGSVAEIVGLALLAPFADSLLWHEESWIFLVPAVLAIALGLSFSWLGRDHKRQINVWEGALFISVADGSVPSKSTEAAVSFVREVSPETTASVGSA